MICLNVSQLCISMHFWANEGLHHALLSKCWLKVFSGHFVTIVDEQGQEQKTWNCGVDGMSCVLWPVVSYDNYMNDIIWCYLIWICWNCEMLFWPSLHNIYYIYMQSFDFAQSFVRIHHQIFSACLVDYILYICSHLILLNRLFAFTINSFRHASSWQWCASTSIREEVKRYADHSSDDASNDATWWNASDDVFEWRNASDDADYASDGSHCWVRQRLIEWATCCSCCGSSAIIVCGCRITSIESIAWCTTPILQFFGCDETEDQPQYMTYVRQLPRWFIQEVIEFLNPNFDATLVADLSQHGLLSLLFLFCRIKPNVRVTELRSLIPIILAKTSYGWK